jgi:AcrR family transcriptional regulator
MATESTKKNRRYRKRRRAELEQETRRRITEATVKLHGTVGPARTTVSGIAKEAGVQRATVYRHFPDEGSLFAACTAHYWSQHPMPDPATWAAISDPGKRLRRALTELYAFYRETEPMLEKTGRDAPLVKSMAEPREAFLGYLGACADAIVAGRPERGAARKRVRGAAGHAVAFPTWQSLIRQEGLDDAEAVAVVAGMVEAAGAARPAGPRPVSRSRRASPTPR